LARYAHRLTDSPVRLPRSSLVGLVVGTFVGLSGIGGASVLVPLVVLALHVKPSLAIGTDLL